MTFGWGLAWNSNPWSVFCVFHWTFPRSGFIRFVFCEAVISNGLQHGKQVAQSGFTWSESEQTLKNKRREQRRLTISLGISCLFTLVFIVLPLTAELIVDYLYESDDLMTWFIPYRHIFNNLNPIMNFFIFTIRHKDISRGLNCLLTCKKYNWITFFHNFVILKLYYCYVFVSHEYHVLEVD